MIKAYVQRRVLQWKTSTFIKHVLTRQILRYVRSVMKKRARSKALTLRAFMGSFKLWLCINKEVKKRYGRERDFDGRLMIRVKRHINIKFTLMKDVAYQRALKTLSDLFKTLKKRAEFHAMSL